ncbi:hypothetical protein Clacol_002913 [Clathrus columnatus]|uniref:Exportin-T n=1 Tax=Clathrus columnatus TaxID=1419009 RepID=A0AAV5A7H1_9AGAM|nr:hypothetical protein Clacol_002913 [Clathrus columnatus]
MDEEISRVVQAVYIAADPSQDRTLHTQALQYLSNVQQNTETWRLALSLFVEVTPDGVRKYSPQARLWALRVLEDFLDERVEPLDENTFQTLQQGLFTYIQTEFVFGPAERNATFADQLLKSARAFSGARHARDTRVRDAVRERDAPIINEAVLTIISETADRMRALRKGEVSPSIEREEEMCEEVVDWGIRAFGSYIHWIDINLTVTPQTIQLLFTLLSDPSLAIRLATSAALLKMLHKGLKSPADKLQLIKVLALGQVLDALEEKTRIEKGQRLSEHQVDEGEESYRESLGRLLCGLGQELVKLWEDNNTSEDIRIGAGELLEQILPVMLRFMSDEYDDTSSTVFPLLTNLFTAYKRIKKNNSDELISTEKRTFLKQVLDVVLEKMKWDSDDDPEDMDEDDSAAFDLLRKDLRIFLDSIQTLDNELVTNTIHSVALSTLTAYESGVTLQWQDVELAIYLVQVGLYHIHVYSMTNLATAGPKGRAAFCEVPGVIAKEKRKTTDYSEFPLNAHGEMMFVLVRSGISSYPHTTVVMQFFETAARYGDFFKVRKDCIIPVIEALIDSRGIHHPKPSIRARASYLFHKFIKEDRNEVPLEIIVRLLDSIRDALVIQVELPELESPDQDILFEAVNEPSVFDSQLYLFEAAGTLVSLTYSVPDQQAAFLRSLTKPLLEEMDRALRSPMNDPQDVLPVLQVHHYIMAFGSIAKGFVDFPNPVPPDWVLPPLDVFEEVAQAVIVSLGAMNRHKIVREATRSAFSRLLASTGPTMTKYIPPLMASLLAHFDSAELVEFIQFIGLLVHKLENQIYDVLDQLITPLSTHVVSILSTPVTDPSERQIHIDTKKAFLLLLNNTMTAKLHSVFTSDRNKGVFESLLSSIVQISQDFSDNNGQKLAFNFLSRAVTAWAQPITHTNGIVNGGLGQLPGFERFMYEQLVPVAFKVPSAPEFNVKDGQMMVLCHEIGGLLQLICKTRGQEAFDYLVNVFLPSQNCPPDVALDFATKIRDMDAKAFKKFFTDFVRISRS